MSKQTKKPLSEFFPDSIHPILEKRALVVGEVAAEYDALLLAVAAALRPQDIIECLHVKAFADKTWELIRMHGFSAKIISNGMPESLAMILQRHERFAGRFGDELSKEARKLAQDYYAGEPQALDTVPKLLASMGLNVESVAAQTFGRRVHELEQINRMITNTENQRDNIMHELERHKAVLGRNLREVVDADFIEAPKCAELEAMGPNSLPANPATKTSGNS